MHQLPPAADFSQPLQSALRRDDTRAGIIPPVGAPLLIVADGRRVGSQGRWFDCSEEQLLYIRAQMSASDGRGGTCILYARCCALGRISLNA